MARGPCKIMQLFGLIACALNDNFTRFCFAQFCFSPGRRVQQFWQFGHAECWRRSDAMGRCNGQLRQSGSLGFASFHPNEFSPLFTSSYNIKGSAFFSGFHPLPLGSPVTSSDHLLLFWALASTSLLEFP